MIKLEYTFETHQDLEYHLETLKKGHHFDEVDEKLRSLIKYDEKLSDETREVLQGVRDHLRGWM